MGTKDSFVVYTGWKEHLELLSDDEKGHLFMALIEYVSTGAVEDGIFIHESADRCRDTEI